MSDVPTHATGSPQPAEPTDAVEPVTAPTTEAGVDPATDPATETVDLAGAERDLAAVEAALVRLDAGTYWTDEVTGEPIPDHVLEADPLARRSTQT